MILKIYTNYIQNIWYSIYIIKSIGSQKIIIDLA